MVISHIVSRIGVMLTAVEALVFGSVFLLIGRFLVEGRGESVASIAVHVLLPTGLVLLCLLVVGGYQSEAWRSPRTMVKRVIGGGVGGAIVIVLIHDLIIGDAKTALEIGIATVCGCCLALLGRLLGRRLAAGLLGPFKRKVLVLGTGSRALVLLRSIQQTPMVGIRLCGFMRLSPEGAPVPDPAPAVPPARVLTSSQRFVEFAVKQGIQEIVVALEGETSPAVREVLLTCRLHGITVTDRTAFIERETGRIGLDLLNLDWMIFAPGFRRGQLRDAFKRCADVAIASILFFLTLPLFPMIALLIKLDSRGPVIYSQARIGLHGKLFTMYKFRSMRTDAEAQGARWAEDNDPRITKFGRILRLSRLDELPQLFNVIRGDMSLVGPRPERPEMLAKLVEEIPYYNERHGVRPGITGWAQTSHTYTSTIEDTKVKLEYDLYYLKNHSLLLDLVILFQTIRVALRGVGAR